MPLKLIVKAYHNEEFYHEPHKRHEQKKSSRRDAEIAEDAEEERDQGLGKMRETRIFQATRLSLRSWRFSRLEEAHDLHEAAEGVPYPRAVAGGSL